MLLFGMQSATSAPVDVQSARKAAQTFLQSAGYNAGKEDMVDISASTPFAEFYTFTFNGGRGFVLVSADDNTDPILGYSLNNPFDPAALPDHVRAWLHGYELEIQHNRNHAKSCTEAQRQWKRLLSGEVPPAVKATVGPFLTTTWNQSPYYNALCPYDSANHGRAVCGCTATATAQIMKFFNHPATGYGNCTYTHRRLGELSADYNVDYQWDSMPTALNANSSDAQINAVATLIYHIGVAVSMDYSANGSGGKTASYGYGGEPSSENAFKYNFKYSPYVWTAFCIDYTTDEWKALMKNELNNGRPILYAGYDEKQAGHAFVIDGYNTYGLYHLNWGWGGNADGDFRITNLNPNDYNFNLFATATIGIEPYNGWDTVGQTTVNATVEGIRGASAADGIVTGSGSYSFGDTITMLATATNEWTRFVQWSDGCKYNPRVTVATGGEVSFTAQFAPMRCDTMRYFTCDNSMNRASNVTPGLGSDTIWGIKLPAASLRNHQLLSDVVFMGRKAGTHTLTVYTGTDHPEAVAYQATFFDSLDYAYTFYTHHLSQPVAVDGTESLWIVLKCTDVDTPGVFSIYGGNPNGLLAGEDLHSLNASSLFSWMIEGRFTWDGVGIEEVSPSEFEVLLSPNPAKGKVRVTLPGLSDVAVLQVYDMGGLLVRQFSVSDQTTDIEGLVPGMYIIKVSTPTFSRAQKLVVGR
jgi:hypothetical protein